MDNKEYTLQFLMRIAEGIARMFGSTCETLIHDMQQEAFPIVAIYNGHVSGRSVGSTKSIYGAQTTQDSEDDVTFFSNDYVNTRVVSANGRFIKSSTFNYIGEGYHYALGVNFDYTPLAGTRRLIDELSMADGDLNNMLTIKAQGQLDGIFDSCLEAVGTSLDRLKKEDRMRLLVLLSEQQFFKYQKAVAFVADKLNVSRYTIYKYIHEIESKNSAIQIL